jgi:hypothetical protein
MVILDLSVFERELPGRLLVCEIVAIGVFVPSPIRAGVRHLIDEISVVAGHATPAGGLSGAKEVGCLAVGGKMVEPRTVRATAAFLVLILGQGIVLGVFAVPRGGTPRPTPQT